MLRAGMRARILRARLVWVPCHSDPHTAVICSGMDSTMAGSLEHAFAPMHMPVHIRGTEGL